MENRNEKKLVAYLGVILISLSIRSVYFINDLLTAIVFMILGLAVLYNYDKK